MVTRRNAVLNKVAEYNDIQARYEAFIRLVAEAFPPGNDFGIEFGNEISYDKRSLTILKHACTITFSGYEADDSYINGMLIFERIISDKERRPLVTIYFDGLGNASDEANTKSFTRSINNQADLRDWFAIRLLEAFLIDMAAASGKHIRGE